MAARTAGNKQTRFEDFLVFGSPGAQTNEDEPAGGQSANAMANAFRAFAAMHNAEIERREQVKARQASKGS